MRTKIKNFLNQNFWLIFIWLIFIGYYVWTGYEIAQWGHEIGKW